MSKIKHTFVFFWICISAVSQTVENQRPDVTPTAPAAYEFLKYGDIPMNEYTGKATITVPIHTIEMDGIQLPLQMNYTTGGIRVTQEASVVGLGWDFNLPAIVQTIKDRDDYGYSTAMQKLPDFTGGTVYPTSGNDHPDITPSNYVGMPATSGYSNMAQYFVASGDFIVANEQYSNQFYDMTYTWNHDSEPDMFRVNIEGEELIMTNDRTKPVSSNPTLLIINGKDNYKVNLITSTINGHVRVTGIKITTPRADQYLFEVVDVIEGNATSSGHLIPGTSGSNYISSKIYRLTSIISRIGNEILIDYNSTEIWETTKRTQNYFRRTGTTSIRNYINSGEKSDAVDYGSLSYFSNNTMNSSTSNSYHSQHQNYNYFTKITTPKEEVHFNYSDRSDYNGMKKMDGVIIKNKLQHSVESYSMNYSYSVSNNADGKTNYLKQRLILNSVTEDGKPPYQFTYNAIKLPTKDSFSIDYWGYYNNHNNTSLIPSMAALGYPQYTDNNQNNFDANLTYSKAQSLERIEYPTGGSSVFLYELNSFDDYTFSNLSTISIGHGLRIERVTNYEKSNSVASVRNYSYTNGKAISKRKFLNTYPEKVLRRTNETKVFSTPVLEVKMDGFTTSNGFGEGDYIGYDKVTITNNDGGLGRTEKYFVNVPNTIFNVDYGKSYHPQYISDRAAFKNGTILREKNFDADSNVVSEVFFDYLINTSTKELYGVNFKSVGNHVKPFYQGMINKSLNMLTSYPIFANSTYLKNKREILYTPTGQTATKQQYTYDTKNRITKEEIYNTKVGSNDKITKEFTYPGTLWSNNFIGIPTREVVKRKGQVISDKHTVYKKYANLSNAILLEDVWNCSRSTSDPSTSNNCINTSFNKYDSRGNLLEYQTNEGIVTSFIYGYQDNYPIAKLQNISYNNISTSVINNLKNLSNQDNDNCTTFNCKEQNLRIALQNLRASYNNTNAFVSTYTFDPLVGVTSMTDQRGYTMYYEYDEFNRLEKVKDQDGNILSENEYKYKNN
ncbi:hypothetical protein [uncultured Aquimarina sp.]|uniref:hypothetical protein n=1 Tax=uncultured Aquimarina sp. TaxID=575652 RepID=UPI00262BB9C4|nr:hypothetical protein [uncultured Aquimarina sp.]